MLDTAEDIPLEVAMDRSADVALDVAGDCQPISLRIVPLVWYAVIKAGKRLTRKLFSMSGPRWTPKFLYRSRKPTFAKRHIRLWLNLTFCAGSCENIK